MTNVDEVAINKIPVCVFDASDRNHFDDNDHSGLTGFYASSSFYTPNPTGGLMGFFTGAQDSVGAYICGKDSGNASGYARTPAGLYSMAALNGSTNLLTIQIAYPYFKEPYASNQTLSGKASEIFAEEFAYISGFPDYPDGVTNPQPPVGSDQAFLLNAFQCTSLYVNRITQSGTVPSASDLSTYYAIPNTFSGDKNGVTYGPPSAPQTPFNPATMSSQTYYHCDGTITQSGSDWSFAT